MIFVYGFAGLRDYHGELHFSPALPDVLDCLRFQLMFQGQVLETQVGQETTRYTLKAGRGLRLRHDGKEIRLSPEMPTLECPNREPAGRSSRP